MRTVWNIIKSPVITEKALAAKEESQDTQQLLTFRVDRRATKPEIRPLRDAETQALSELVARRRQIVQMIVAEENRLRMVLARQAQKSIKRLLAALRRELESLDAD